MGKVSCVQSVHKNSPNGNRGSGLFGGGGFGGNDLYGPVDAAQDTVVTVQTTGDVVLQQHDRRFTIYVTMDKSLRRKAICYSIPRRLAAELKLPPEATSLITMILELDPTSSATILDERGIARLSGAARGLSIREGSKLPAVPEKATPKTGLQRTCNDLFQSQQISPQIPLDSGQTPEFQGRSLFGAPSKSQTPGLRGTGNSSRTPNPFIAPRKWQTSPQTVDKASGRSKDTDPGWMALKDAIIQRGKALGLSPEDIFCIQLKSVMPISPKKSAESSSNYLPTYIGFLGELFVRCLETILESHLHLVDRIFLESAPMWLFRLRPRQELDQ